MFLEGRGKCFLLTLLVVSSACGSGEGGSGGAGGATGGTGGSEPRRCQIASWDDRWCTCSDLDPPSGNNNAYVCKYGTDETLGVCCYADIGVVSICKCGVRTSETCSGFTPRNAYPVPSCPSGID